MRRKETAGINYALNFLNNKLRICVVCVEGFMTNLFFYYGAVSPLLKIFMSVNNYEALGMSERCSQLRNSLFNRCMLS